MFQDAYPYHVDDKGRLKMPAEFVAGLGDSFTITKGSGNCLWIRPDADWLPVLERLQSESLVDQRVLTLQRYFVGSAKRVSLDSQGRLTLPPVLREYYGIQHEVMVVGTGPRVEVWARDKWDAYEASLSDDLIEELARSAGL